MGNKGMGLVEILIAVILIAVLIVGQATGNWLMVAIAAGFLIGLFVISTM